MTDRGDTEVVGLLLWLAFAGAALCLSGFCVYCLVIAGRYHRRQRVRVTGKNMVTYSGMYVAVIGFFLIAIFACESALQGTSITLPPPVRAGIALIMVVGIVTSVLAVAVGICLDLLTRRPFKLEWSEVVALAAFGTFALGLAIGILTYLLLQHI